MQCKHCGQEIKQGALFCTKCGNKVEKEIEKEVVASAFCSGCGSQLKPEAKFCTKCGKKIEIVQSIKKEEQEEKKTVPAELVSKCKTCGKELKPGAKFCANCGSSVIEEESSKSSNVTQKSMPTQSGTDVLNHAKQQSVTAVKQSKTKTETTKKKNIVMIVILVVAVLAVIGGIVVFWLGTRDTNSSNDNNAVTSDSIVSGDVSEQIEMNTSVEETMAETTENPLSNVEYDLTTSGSIAIEGEVKKSDGEWILKMDSAHSFGDYDSAGDVVSLNDVKKIYIDDSVLMDNMLERIRKKSVTMTGDVYIENEKVYITPFEIVDAAGTELIAEFESMSDDYIIPYSDTVLLTEEDVEYLTLQEINYAKNEIYARHGRKFNSPELQDYFNSKSWYYGTISPEEFDRNTSKYLSELENKNAAFLSQVESDMGTYQLDK